MDVDANLIVVEVKFLMKGKFLPTWSGGDFFLAHSLDRFLKRCTRPLPTKIRRMGHTIRTWFVVGSENCSVKKRDPVYAWTTPVRRRLSLVQAVRGKLIPTGLALVLGMKARSPMYSYNTPHSICD